MTSRDRLLRSVLDLQWAQWTELGVGGTRGTNASLIDPEALLAVSSAFAVYDPRLFDEVLDWLSRFSHLLDVTRLRRIGARELGSDPRVLAALIAFMRDRVSRSKWSGVADRALAHEGAATYGERTLFRSPDGTDLPVFGEGDAFFAARGLVRPPVQLRGLSTAPDLHAAALARLRLRELVGQGVRAEVLLALASADHAHGRGIAESSAYSQRQVAEYLSSLAETGLAECWRDGRRVQYRLSPPLASALGAVAPRVDWVAAFGLVTALFALAGSAKAEADSYRASTTVRAGLTKLVDLLPIDGFDVAIPKPDRYPGEQVLDLLDGVVSSVCERLELLAL